MVGAYRLSELDKQLLHISNCDVPVLTMLAKQGLIKLSLQWSKGVPMRLFLEIQVIQEVADESIALIKKKRG